MTCSVMSFSGVKLTGNIDDDTTLFADIFKNDAVFRKRRIAPVGSAVSFSVLFFDGMVDPERISEDIVKPLSRISAHDKTAVTAHYIAQRVLLSGEVSAQTDLKEMLKSILFGDTLILIDGSVTALTVNTKGFRLRSVEEPVDERVTQGPREGFLESAMINLSMIRRRLATPDLCICPVSVGRRTDTEVYICYLETLTDNNMLNTLKERLSRISNAWICSTPRPRHTKACRTP